MIYNFCTFLNTPKRVDMYISALFDELSRSYVQKLIDSGSVLLNGEPCKKNIKLHNKDELKITIQAESIDIEPEDMNLEIVYEDQNMLVINKEA
jgi:23S rRNA pseudouridine1911/1915/1917 synthase